MMRFWGTNWMGMSPDNALHLDLGTTQEYYGIPDALDQLRAHQVHGRDFEVVRLGPVTSC